MNWDVPVDRIQSVNVSRNLEGVNGTLVWDLYSAAGIALRPPQNAGKLALGVIGGVDTVPGTIYRGIAMGNAQDSSPDSDKIEIPLNGRDVKISDQGNGLRLINAPFFDGEDHREVMQYLCDYGGIPFNDNNTAPYRLPSGNVVIQSLVDFKSGTPVWDAITEVQKLAATVAFFDRFGVLQYYDVGTNSGVNWNYPLTLVKSYNDKPDVAAIHNKILTAGLVRQGSGVHVERIFNPFDPESQIAYPFMISDPQPGQTTPDFSWDKMLFYVVPGIVELKDLQKEHRRIVSVASRCRAAGSVTIPGNSQIELWDTFNFTWLITGVTHAVDTEAKTWTTTLNLEYIVGVGERHDQGGEEEGDPPGDPQPPEDNSDTDMTETGFDPTRDADFDFPPDGITNINFTEDFVSRTRELGL
jgi:hypothetical protein